MGLNGQTAQSMLPSGQAIKKALSQQKYNNDITKTVDRSWPLLRSGSRSKPVWKSSSEIRIETSLIRRGIDRVELYLSSAVAGFSQFSLNPLLSTISAFYLPFGLPYRILYTQPYWITYLLSLTTTSFRILPLVVINPDQVFGYDGSC